MSLIDDLRVKVQEQSLSGKVQQEVWSKLRFTAFDEDEGE